MARKIEVIITGDSKSLQQALDKSTKSTSKLSSSFTTMAKRTALVGGAAGLGLLAVGTKKAITAASDLNESINAVNVVFGKAAKQVLKFSEGAAKKAGLSMREFNESVVPIGAALQNYGFSAKQAATTSINLTKRAADMASVFNTDVGTALTAIQAALRGESDPIEQFGVGLTEAALKAEALKRHMKLTNGELTASQKTQLRLALIMQQTNKFAGDFANTSGSLANQQKILKAQLEDVAAKIGMKLTPAVQAAIAWLRDHWPEISAKIEEFWAASQPALEAFGELVTTVAGLIEKHWGTIGPIVNNVAQSIKNSFAVITGIIKVFTAVLRGDWTAAWNALKQIFNAFWDEIRNRLNLFKNTFGLLAKNIGVAIKNGVVDGVTGIASAVWGVISRIGSTISDSIGQVLGWGRRVGANLIDGIVSGLTGLPGRIVSLLRAAINAVIDRINSALEFSFSVDTHIPGVGRKGIHFNAPDIPHLAKGGIVTKPTLALIGERGPEAVVPLGAGGYGGGIHFHFPNYAGDKRELMQIVRSEVTKLRRRGGTF